MLAGPDEVVFEEAGIKVSGTPALCLPTPYPPHLRQGQNEGTLAGPAAVALPAQEEVEAYEEHEDETGAFVFKRLCMRAPGRERCPLQQEGQSLGCSPSPAGEGNRFENWTGTTRAPRQQESPVLSSFKYSLSAYDVLRMV